ncbi:hypothetical protein KAFR_0H01070 [Kazachstania africana CBS 2517]|uniref:Phenylalanine--tRNA ligase, mitochondrial n=1 Tax=Kazachstania africana (strain ATCC 22294 / BCRC 22015 / CBS 2517 / CECT 1963 / NBRC 1671 / NRRL Y-8276) TaxID=1071382 RepID=H2AYW1_KAZAF|nr:hypothetical protein KAFR_0H01070 [Kazachstania africana CBS 2517]CCF59517.1 hypothetical protein KAFR_0H01070 [Kazachstania africana CBS 2517]
MIVLLSRSKTFIPSFRRVFAYYSTSLPNTLDIAGKKYDTDSNYTNVTPSILSHVNENLHLRKHHPINTLRELIENTLNSVDNTFKTYNSFSPIVTTYQNFDVLDIPVDHPGRSKSDTYYINKDYLLRTHTSAHELECFHDLLLQENITNRGFLISADVYRRDEIDRTHYPVFYQMEGARIWDRSSLALLKSDLSKLENKLLDIDKGKNIIRLIVQDDVSLEGNPKQNYMTMEEYDLCSRHLKRSIELLIKQAFAQKIKNMTTADINQTTTELNVRWIKTSFPWTAPSWEIEVWWNGEWLELCGCGLIKQDVLLKAGYRSDSTIGWAFGLGLDRIAMLLFEIPDIRLLWTKDERFHQQFRDGAITSFKPYSKYPGSMRDMAFWLPDESLYVELHENDIMEIVRSVAGNLVESVKLIDKYRTPDTNRTSLCYRINYQSMDRNITNQEVNKLQELVQDQLMSKYNVILR